MAERTFECDRQTAGDVTRLTFRGTLRLDDGQALWQTVERALGEGHRTAVDLAAIERADSASLALLVALEAEAGSRGAALEVTGANPDVARLLALHRERTSPASPPRAKPGFFQQVGEATVLAFRTTRQAFDFVGRAVVSAIAATRDPSSVQWSSILPLMERAGANSVPITVMINFLIGAILALQASPPLEQFGANIFVADLVGLSVTRELAPLMTAIIVTGRSGAAYAAELGTMKVSEEVDALRTFGFDPMHFLVFPRVIALLLVVPLLTVLADFVGLAGGLVIAVLQLDLTMVAYLTRLESAVDFNDVLGGIIKSGVFAVTIALIACERGLSTRGGAAGVGASTTSAVVLSLFSLVFIDSLFTYVFTLIEF